MQHDYFNQFPEAKPAGPLGQTGYPPAVANPAAAIGALPVGLQAAMSQAVGPAAAAAPAAAGQNKHVFRDEDNKVYDVGLLRSARKTLETLFGPGHHIVKEIQGKLALHDQQQMQKAPLHIAVGKAQRRLKGLESRIARLCEERAALGDDVL